MNSHLTAISRTKPPTPVLWLLREGLLHGRILDYGCGKCRDLNNIWFDMPGQCSIFSYDPHYQPVMPEGLFDAILCTYVLCTVEEREQGGILWDIQRRLKDNGIGFISVRNDKPKWGYGISSKGTFQRNVLLPFLYQLRETSQYRTYLLTPRSRLI